MIRDSVEGFIENNKNEVNDIYIKEFTEKSTY